MAGNQYLRIQPIFPYFLRNRLNHPTPALPILGREQIEGSAEKSPSSAQTALPPEWGELEGGTSPSVPPTALPPQRGDLVGGGLRQSIERAFHRFYDELGGALAGLIKSKEAPQRRLGQELIGIEYENLMTAVRLALADRARFYNPFEAIFRFLDGQSAHQQAAALCSVVLAERGNYSREQIDGQIGVNYYLVFERLATSNFLLKQYAAAQKAYKDSLALIQQLGGISEEVRGNYTAVVYHQLGYVAQEQRRWEEAEGAYRRALALKVEFNDRYSQASTYHQLGIVAAEQRRWEEAEGAYRQALALFVEFNDRYSQAMTYHQLGIVSVEQRRWEEAESHYQQALALKVEFNDRYSQASTYGQLGNLMLEQRRWEEAEGAYRRALALFVEFNDRYEQAGTYHQLGMVAEETGRNADAIAAYLTALETFQAYRDEHNQGIVLESLGRVWQASGDGTIPERAGALLGVSAAEAARLLGGDRE